MSPKSVVFLLISMLIFCSSPSHPPKFGRYWRHPLTVGMFRNTFRQGPIEDRVVPTSGNIDMKYQRLQRAGTIIKPQAASPTTSSSSSLKISSYTLLCAFLIFIYTIWIISINDFVGMKITSLLGQFWCQNSLHSINTSPFSPTNNLLWQNLF